MPRAKPILLAALLTAALALAQQSGDYGQQIAQLINNLGSAFIGIVVTGLEYGWYWISAALFWIGLAEIIFAIFIFRWHWTRTIPGIIFLAVAMGVPLGVAIFGQAAGWPPDVLAQAKCTWAGYLFHGIFCGGGITTGTTPTTTAIG